MKKILSILGAITLIGTSSTSLVACTNFKSNIPSDDYTPEELAKLKKENEIDTNNKTIHDNLEGIAPQEKPFNTFYDKGDHPYIYYIIGRKSINDIGCITSFTNGKPLNDNPLQIGFYINGSTSGVYDKNIVIYRIKYNDNYTIGIYDINNGGFNPISMGYQKNGDLFKGVYQGNASLNPNSINISVNAGNKLYAT